MEIKVDIKKIVKESFDASLASEQVVNITNLITDLYIYGFEQGLNLGTKLSNVENIEIN